MKNIYRKTAINIFLSFTLLCLSFLGRATTYYVSNYGNDSNPGLSKDSPWKTLSKISSLSFQPGDSILLRKGDTWRESFTINNSGTNSQRITFSNYGTGQKPLIFGSRQSTSWADQGGNVWKSDASFTTNPYNLGANGGGNIWLINNDGSVITGVVKANTGTLVSEGDWVWSGNAIYMYSTSNPATKYTAIEVETIISIINLNHKSFITVDGIDIRYCNVCIYEGYITQGNSGLIVRNCELAYTGYPNGNSAGIHFCYNNSLIENNIIHDHGRRGISLVNVNSSFAIKNITIRNNTFYHGYHTTSVDMQATTGYAGGFDSIFIYNNLIYDDIQRISPAYPMQMFISDQGSTTAKLTNIMVYYNTFKGITGAAINIGGAEDVKIFNNTFYTFNEIITSTSEFLFIGQSNVTIKNNIFYSQLPNDVNLKGMMYITNISNITSDYNCYYRSNPGLIVFHVVSVGDYASKDSTTIRSTLGWDTHSLFKDPKVISASDLSLQSTSPCKSAGINVGLPFLGKAPDIGSPQPSGNNPAIVSAGTYTILARHSGKVIGIKGASTADGAIVEQETYTGATSQQFIITDLGTGYFQIAPSSNTTKRLDVTGGSLVNGATIIQYTANGGLNQQWSFINVGNGYYQIVSRRSGKCLDVTNSSAADGAVLQQYTYWGGFNQQFSLSLLKSALALESSKDTSFSNSAISEANLISHVVMYPNPSQNGKFYVNLNSHLPEETFEITIYNMNGQCLYSQMEKGDRVIEVNAELIIPDKLYNEFGVKCTIKNGIDLWCKNNLFFLS